MNTRFWLTILLLPLFVKPVYSAPVDITSPPSQKTPEQVHLVAVIPTDAPPAYFRDKKSGKASGFAVDVMTRVAEKSGIRLSFINGTSWSDIIKKLKNGEADLVPGIGITDERKKALAFTEPFDTASLSILVRSRNSTIKELDSGHEIGVMKGSSAYEYLNNNHAITLAQYDSYTSGLFDLLAGHIDAFVCDEHILLSLAREAGVEERIKTIGPPLVEIKRAIAVRKSDAQLVVRLNKVVTEFVGSPEYQELYQKWYGKPKPYWTPKRIIFSMTVVAVFAVCLMALWRYLSLLKLNRVLLKNMAELERAEQNRIRLETAIKAAAEAVVVSDHKGVIQYVNPAFERITGYTEEEAKGNNLHLLDSGKHDEAFYKEIREVLKYQGVWTGRLVNKKKDGTFYEEDCTYSVVRDPSGKIINHVAIKRDVTEKLRLESIAQSVDTMNNIGYVFSGVRHELGNPINTINMLMYVLRTKLDTLPHEKLKTYVDQVATEVSKIEYLLKSLKNFNMYENLELQHVKVSSFIETFVPLLKETLEKKGIYIETSFDAEADGMYVDPRALQQVLLNVLVNASEAMDGRQNPKIALSAFKTGGMLRIRVEDNGCGIPGDKLNDLFKPFYTTKVRGTGLGLVIVKKMLAKMNGTVEISSDKDRGTTVDITLPAGMN